MEFCSFLDPGFYWKVELPEAITDAGAERNNNNNNNNEERKRTSV